MGKVCLQCGDKGSTNAFVYCVKCLKFAVHRYCLAVIPETLDEFVHWVCGDDCEGKEPKKSKKRKRGIIHSIINKDEYGLDNVASCNEENKKLVEMACGTKLSSKVKDDRHSEHIDQNPVSVKSSKKKKKKKKKTIISSEENHLEYQPVEETTGSACDTKLPCKVQDNKGSEQGDEKQISVRSSKNKKKKKKKTTISSGENHLENQCAEEMKNDKGSEQGDEKRISAKNSKKKKKNTISSSEENLLENQHAEETTEFTCDAELACKVKDDSGSERRDKECISVKRTKKKKRKAVILSENKPLDLGNQCAEKSSEQKSEAGIGNGELEDREKRNSSNSDKNNIGEDFPIDLPVVSSAEPVAMPIWRGSFSILNEKRGILNGLLAHVSVLACPKVYDEALQFQPVLHLEMLPKSDVWPKSFKTSEPCGDNIALYFFPSKSSERDFDCLVDEMMHNELALKAIVQNAELLIFNSSELPLLYWKFQGKYYLWGVFRQKQSTPSISHPCRVESVDKNPIKHTNKTSVATNGFNAFSPRSPLSNSASYGSHN